MQEIGEGREENEKYPMHSAIFLPFKSNPYLEMFATPSSTRPVTSGLEE